MGKLPKLKPVRKLSASGLFRLTIVSAFAVIVLMFLGIYHQFQTILLEAINEQNTSFVSQVSSTADFAEEMMQNIANQIFYSQTVNKLRSYPTLTNAQIISGIRELNSYCAASTIIDSIYVYNGKQDYIYSTETFGAVNDTLKNFADSVAAELFEGRAPGQSLSVIPRYYYAANSYTDRMIYSFMFYEQDIDGLPEDNAIMINVSAAWFNKLYFGSGGDDSFIIDRMGDLIAAEIPPTDLEVLTERIFEKTAEGQENGYFLYTPSHGGEKRIYLFSDMEKYDWYHVMSLNYRECLNGLQRIQEKTLISLFWGFAVLCVAGTSISLHIYLPFRKVVKRMTAFEPSASDDTEKLLEILNQLIENNSSSESIRQSVQEIIHGQALKDLLQGKFQREDWNQLSGQYHFQLEPDMQTVLCLVSGLRLGQYLECFKQSIPRCEGVEIQNDYTVIFLQQVTEDVLPHLLKKLSSQHPSTYFITSQAVCCWEELPKVYQQLQEARQLVFLHPERRLVFLQRQKELDSSIKELDEQREHIIACLKRGASIKAVAGWRSFVEELDGKNYSTVRYALNTLGREVCSLQYPTLEEHEEFAVAYKNYQNVLNQLKNIQTLDTFFEPLFQSITARIRQEQSSRKGDVIPEVIRAIEGSYCNSQLSSQSLASQFGLSPVYLSRIFRKEVGTSLLDYINHLRIGRAQEILADPSVKVKDVPQQIGIDNKQYFVKLFKDITGMTPKQYQNGHVPSESGSIKDLLRKVK